MRKILCKIWNFVLMLFGDIVDVVLDVIEAVAELAIEIFTLIVDEVTEAVSGTGIGTWLKIGFIGWGIITLLGMVSDSDSNQATT